MTKQEELETEIERWRSMIPTQWQDIVSDSSYERALKAAKEILASNVERYRPDEEPIEASIARHLVHVDQSIMEDATRIRQHEVAVAYYDALKREDQAEIDRLEEEMNACYPRQTEPLKMAMIDYIDVCQEVKRLKGLLDLHGIPYET